MWQIMLQAEDTDTVPDSEDDNMQAVLDVSDVDKPEEDLNSSAIVVTPQKKTFQKR